MNIDYVPVSGVIDIIRACAEYATEFFTIAEVASILKVSRDTVTRQFSRRPGVITIGAPESNEGSTRRRRYRSLRIPREALDRFIVESRVSAA